MEIKGVVTVGYKGRLEIGVQDTEDLRRSIPESRIPNGDTRYESRHGVGTASGEFPIVPVVGVTLGVGDHVVITEMVKVIEIPNTPPWARKLVVVKTVVTKTAKQCAQEEEEKDRAAQALSRNIDKALSAGTAEGRLALLQYSEKDIRMTGEMYASRLSWEAVKNDVKESGGKMSIIDAHRIWSATSKPTLSFRAVPKSWRL